MPRCQCCGGLACGPFPENGTTAKLELAAAEAAAACCACCSNLKRAAAEAVFRPSVTTAACKSWSLINCHSPPVEGSCTTSPEARCSITKQQSVPSLSLTMCILYAFLALVPISAITALMTSPGIMPPLHSGEPLAWCCRTKLMKNFSRLRSKSSWPGCQPVAKYLS